MFKSILILSLALSVSLAIQKARYDNYMVLRIEIGDEKQLNLLKEIENLGNEYSFWKSPRGVGTFADLVVPPHKFAEIDSFINKFGFKVETIIDNLQSLIDNEKVGLRADELNWEAYYPWQSIRNFINKMYLEHQPYVKIYEMRRTHENRAILGVGISYKEGNQAIYIESNIHAREWITSATATWFINELLTSQDPAVRDLAENIDWYIFPVVNVDGYEYTHFTDRMWRKNRKPSSSLCVGTDLNRNFDYLWFTGGASNTPCSETYAGPRAFSEPESEGILHFFGSIERFQNVTAYISFHSYGQYLMYPYGSSQAETINNEGEHIAVGNAAVSKLKERYGTEYVMGNLLEVLYEASGVSIDWAKGKFDIPFAFTYEFRDKGKTGFLLPADQIIPNAEEVMDSMFGFVQKARELGYFKRNVQNK